jgi:Septum formation/Protein of unknown function (DUF2510)
MSAPTPGWNPDPTGRHEYRYWDGGNWTDDVSDNGVTSVDPVDTPASIGGEPTAPFDPTQQYTPPGQADPYGAQPGYGQPAGPGGYGQQAGPGFGAPGAPGGPGAPGAPGGYGTYGSGSLPPGQPARSGPPVPLIVGGIVVAVLLVVGLVVLLTGGDDDGGDDDTATDDVTTTTAADDDDPADTTVTTEESPTTTEESTGPTDADVFSLQVGDCLVDTSTDGEVQEVPVVPCSEPHASEIFYSHMIDAASLPSDSEMETIIDEACVGNFESFVGLDYYSSELTITWLQPTEGSWSSGDRELLCIVADPSGEVTGSLAGANR